MKSFGAAMAEYEKQVRQGDIVIAYRGLLKFFGDLKAHLYANHPDFLVSDRIYQGNMDVTFITFTTETLKQRKLKMEILFTYESFQFEIWLSGVNKKFQYQYWLLMKEKGWHEYPLAETTDGVLYITRSLLSDKPDFDDLNELARVLGQGATEFTRSVEGFVSSH